MPKVEVIARLLILQDDHVLLARKVGGDNTYLPGGHVEHAESARDALQREAEEEVNRGVEVGEFLGVVEHCYDNGKKVHHEYNLVFVGKLEKEVYPQAPASVEEDIEFLWQPVQALDKVNLLPTPMRNLVRDVHGERAPKSWSSTMEETE
jgi:8-oxo-dGTP pyrophosphatase MutT (NUDIX family)